MSRKKSAFITGITGQDGSYLAELLLAKDYKVWGLVRRNSAPINKHDRIKHIMDNISLVDGDMTDTSSLLKCLSLIKPDEIYNLAAQSFVGTSWDQPIVTCNINGLGVVRLLECVRKACPKVRFYQASSSELFGNASLTHKIQHEETPFIPRSPYGYSKLLAYWAVINYRDSYGLHASNGILFNHESPRRGKEFVTRKISLGVAKIKLGYADYISLGNLNAKRDWGFAGDYVKAMWKMLQQPNPDDYIIATGESHTVADFCREAFKVIGISNWMYYVKVDDNIFRPADVPHLCGDYSKASKILNWSPSLNFDDLVKLMVNSDIDLLSNNEMIIKEI